MLFCSHFIKQTASLSRLKEEKVVILRAKIIRRTAFVSWCVYRIHESWIQQNLSRHLQTFNINSVEAQTERWGMKLVLILWSPHTVFFWNLNSLILLVLWLLIASSSYHYPSGNHRFFFFLQHFSPISLI